MRIAVKTLVNTNGTAQITISIIFIILRSLNTFLSESLGRLCQAATISIEPAQCKGILEKISGQRRVRSAMIITEVIAETIP
jgi:hypothetical protein